MLAVVTSVVALLSAVRLPRDLQRGPRPHFGNRAGSGGLTGRIGSDRNRHGLGAGRDRDSAAGCPRTAASLPRRRTVNRTQRCTDIGCCDPGRAALPNRYMRPFGAINPRVIWNIVILMMSVSAAGYVSGRLLGPPVVLPIVGLASGFVASAATIGAMGARALQHPNLARPAVPEQCCHR